MRQKLIKEMITPLIIFAFTLISCQATIGKDEVKQSAISLQGTWKLLRGITIAKGDSTVTDYTKNMEFIKIINKTHFAFFNHDLNKGKDSTPVFSSGGGKYSLTDNTYTEHLEYCSDRQWEGNDFTFTVTINNDTLIQKGIEKIENIGVNRINIEKYIRISQ